MEEEQQFLLVPPVAPAQDWQYWKFAHWMAGEHAFAGLADYFGWVEQKLSAATDG